MKLYKAYKEEVKQKQKEAQDRKNAALPDQIVIIYEESSLLPILRYAAGFLLFLGILILIGAAAIWICSLME